MGLKGRLIIMNFLQFFIWGSWLLTIGAYWFQNKNWSGTDFGAIFSTMGVALLFMPAIAGIIAVESLLAASRAAPIRRAGGKGRHTSSSPTQRLS